MYLHQKTKLGLFLLGSLLLTACVSSNSVMFGSTPLKLDYSELQAKTANLFYTNLNQGIGIGVIRDVMPNANSHLTAWTQAMIAEQEGHRGSTLIKKQLDQITYYEVIDQRAQVKIIYVFGANEKNTALLIKFSKFPVDAVIPDTFIQNLYNFKAF